MSARPLAVEQTRRDDAVVSSGEDLEGGDGRREQAYRDRDGGRKAEPPHDGHRAREHAPVSMEGYRPLGPGSAYSSIESARVGQWRQADSTFARSAAGGASMRSTTLS